MSQIGKTTEVRLRALSPDAAEARDLPPEDGFQSVLVNSRLTALMELAAARLMRPLLAEGETSVSVEMNVTHLVPNTQGELRAVATSLGTRGRMHHFRVDAFDVTGLVASAEHTRAIVVPRRLIEGARRRAGRPTMLFNV